MADKTMFTVLVISIIIITNMSNELHGENVVITSLNTHGAMSNGIYIERLMKKCDILCVQEHYLYPDMHGFLRTLSSDIEGFICSDNSMDIDDYPRIRKGGTAILWKKSISCNITALHDIGNERIMAIKIQSANYQNEAMKLKRLILPNSLVSI